MFEDCFAHLGKEALYQSSGAAPFPIRVLIKQPDTAYEMGDGQVIGHMAIFEIRIDELCLDLLTIFITRVFLLFLLFNS